MYLLEAREVTKDYAQHRALDQVSIAIEPGAIFGLLGPNGAGKTSLIRIINQITAPDAGSIWFNGSPLQEIHRNQIGYLPEERGLYKKMKVGDQLLYLAQLKGLTEREALDKLKVWLTKFDIKPWWNKSIQDLSKGMQQKIQFVSTVMHEPKLIILDEPFSGFDPINANLIKDEILELREKGCTIIFSTHRMESVEELCDHVALIYKSKKVLDGKKEDIKKQFKSNTYFVEYKGNLPEELQVKYTQHIGEDVYRSDIILATDKRANDLLAALIPKVEVRSFGENIPSMNDIFIQVVSQASNHSISTI